MMMDNFIPDVYSQSIYTINYKKLKKNGIKCLLFVDVAFNSHKPFKKKYQKIMELYHFKVNEIACIGDQLLTDILGANRMGFTSILVNRIAPYETLPTRINRFFEKFVLKNLAKKKLLVKGEYYN